MKVIDYPKLILHYEAKTLQEFNQAKNQIWIESKQVKGSFQDISTDTLLAIRHLLTEIRYKGFRIKEIKEMYYRIDVPISITIGEIKELQNYLGIGLKNKVSFYVHLNQNMPSSEYGISVAFEYEKSKYEKEIVSKKMIQFIEKRNDCLILYEMFKDEKYIKRAKKIMRSLKKMEQANKK